MHLRMLASLVATTVVFGLALALLGFRDTGERYPVSSAAAATPAPKAEKPNIVVVMADDMRADDVRFMPSLRTLVTDRGLKFRNSFSPYPLCCPSRSSLLSGQYAHNHKVFDNNAPFGFGGFDDSRTLATSLRDAGYSTGFIGKYLNSYGIARSRVTGEHSWTYVPTGWSDWYATLQRPPRLKDRYPSGGTYDYFHPIFNVNGRADDTHKGEYQTNLLGRFGRKLVQKYSGVDQPFFLLISSLAPHDGRPHESDDVDSTLGIDGRVSTFKTPARPNSVKGRFDAVVHGSPGLPAKGGPSEDDVSDKPLALRRLEMDESERELATALTRQRAESLVVLDQQVRRITKTLRKQGELENTVFVFTSDNGFFLGEHRLRTGKRMGYEPSIRVPLVIAGPGIPHGVRDDPATTTDLTATILDLAGAQAPRRADGRSLVPSFEADRGWSAPVVTEGVATGPPPPYDPRSEDRGFTDPRTTIGIRTSRYKLIRDVSGTVELYDLDEDPNELVSVADDPKYREIQKQLTTLWHRFKDCAGQECTAPLPESLAASPAETTASTKLQSDGVLARYGLTF